MESTMPWIEITRLQYRRDGLRVASDTTDAEWALLQPLMPSPAGIGRPRTTDLRAVVNAILYTLASGCQWRALRRGVSPRSHVQGDFYRLRGGGAWQFINRRHLQPERKEHRKPPAPARLPAPEGQRASAANHRTNVSQVAPCLRRSRLSRTKAAGCNRRPG